MAAFRPGRVAALLLAVAALTGPEGVRAQAARPWEQDKAVVDSTMNAARQRGIQGVGEHLADLEAALADAGAAAKAAASSAGPTRYVLVDGQAQTLTSLLGAAAEQKDHPAGAARQSVAAVESPYPVAALLLGSYYNEVGKPLEALRVLEAGLALPTETDLFGGGHYLPLLTAERGAALVSLKRWPEALADYEGGLKTAGLSASAAARLQRGRGFALTELGRLDEAEAAYHRSLELAPNNPTALHELAYIASLRAGGRPTSPGIYLPPK